MEDVRRVGKTFDAIAKHFDKTRQRPWKEVVDFLKGGSGKLLDMGCGNGRHLKVALEFSYDIVGLDASRKLLDISIKKMFGKGSLICGDVKGLPFKEDSFDTVIYIATIHHLSEDRVDSLKEAKRVLKPGGRILVSAWAREQDRWELEEGESDVLVPWHLEDGRIVDRYYHLYTLDELADDVEKADIKLVEAFDSNNNNYVEGRKWI